MIRGSAEAQKGPPRLRLGSLLARGDSEAQAPHTTGKRSIGASQPTRVHNSQTQRSGSAQPRRSLQPTRAMKRLGTTSADASPLPRVPREAPRTRRRAETAQQRFATRRSRAGVEHEEAARRRRGGGASHDAAAKQGCHVLRTDATGAAARRRSSESEANRLPRTPHAWSHWLRYATTLRLPYLRAGAAPATALSRKGPIAPVPVAQPLGTREKGTQRSAAYGLPH